MSVLTDLQTAKENLSAKLLEISENPKPSYSIDGQSVSWDQFFRMLTEQIKALNELIAIEGGPIELVTSSVS